jgi:hypothetical protein
MKLLDRLAEVAARLHLSPLTVECYQRWVSEFLTFCATPAQLVFPPAPAVDEIDIGTENGTGLICDIHIQDPFFGRPAFR